MSTADAKGDYKVVIDQDSEAQLGPSRTASFAAQGGLGPRASPTSFDHLLNHPALPVLCYCVSSIVMTVSSPLCPLSLPDVR